MKMNKQYKVGPLEVFRNINGEIVINDTSTDLVCVCLDECMAEKLCKYVMAVAQEIRSEEK